MSAAFFKNYARYLEEELDNIYECCSTEKEGSVELNDINISVKDKYPEVSDFLQNELWDFRSCSNGPNHLITKENFKSCIKNIIFSNKQGDYVSDFRRLIRINVLKRAPRLSRNSSPHGRHLSPFSRPPTCMIDTLESLDNGNLENHNDSNHFGEENKKLKTIKDNLEKKLFQYENYIQNLETQISTINHENNKNLKELESLKEKLSNYRNCEEESIEKDEKLSKLEYKCQKFKNLYEKEKERNETFDNKIFTLSLDLNVSNEEKRNKAKQLKEIENINQSLYNELEELKTEKINLLEEIALLVSEQDDKESLLKRISELSFEKQNLQMQLADLNALSLVDLDTEIRNVSKLKNDKAMSLESELSLALQMPLNDNDFGLDNRKLSIESSSSSETGIDVSNFDSSSEVSLENSHQSAQCKDKAIKNTATDSSSKEITPPLEMVNNVQRSLNLFEISTTFPVDLSSIAVIKMIGVDQKDLKTTKRTISTNTSHWNQQSFNIQIKTKEMKYKVRPTDKAIYPVLWLCDEYLRYIVLSM